MICCGCRNFLVREDGTAENLQEGVFRTNCIDCLDRTNVVQSLVSQMLLARTTNGMYLTFFFINSITTRQRVHRGYISASCEEEKYFRYGSGFCKDNISRRQFLND